MTTLVSFSVHKHHSASYFNSSPIASYLHYIYNSCSLCEQSACFSQETEDIFPLLLSETSGICNVASASAA